MSAAMQPMTQTQLFPPKASEPQTMLLHEETWLLALSGQSGAPQWFVEKARSWAFGEANILRECLEHLDRNGPLVAGIDVDLQRIEAALEAA